MDEFEKFVELSHPTWPSLLIVSESDAMMEDLWGLRQPIEPEMCGPFPVNPDGMPVLYLDYDVVFPSGVVGDLRPSAKILLHPIMRNYWSIAIVEQATGRTAVIRNGYIELVKV